jgi:DNA-binding CsgD family transcriptional regulator
LPLYCEYYRPSSVEYQLVTAISARVRQIGVALDRDVADFSDDERLSLELLRPHLMQAYHNAQSMDLLTRAVETGEKRLVSVDRSGSCASAVDDVWRLFEKYFGVSLCRGYLPDALLRWVEHERPRLADDSDVPSPPVPLIVDTGNERLTLQFIWGGRNADRDAVLLEETQTPSVSPVAAWDLTPRESEVLALLAQGRTNAEIGLALFISSLTVKKHLEHIYEKMDVHGRAGAVGRRHR